MQNPFKGFKDKVRGFKNPFRDVRNPFPHLRGRTMYRSPEDALVFGVCAGMAEYLQVDPVFVRLAVVAIAAFGNVWPVVLAYALAAFLMPIDPAQDSVAAKQEPKDVTPSEPVERMDENLNV